ncbi:uncharacterized protein LOC114872476 isoform X2 [Osmia bicornis bicornis]|uniref:uncharacterized protein LOC114872476 isoform X2 n=1 Tax=Osmia bicornis bicornis TaxID=1437191 RepID=UPI0010F46F0A|nr:uncharacterized protein LOC114872476 isoform X2 [Osmia bicornis bicornis]
MAAKIQFLVLLCVSTLFISGFADTIDDETDNVQDISSLVDIMLPTVREYIEKNGMDPMELDSIHKNLPGLLIRNRSISLTNGQLKGLSGIKRIGETILISNTNAHTVIATMGFDVLDGTYDFLLQGFLIKKQGQINGRFGNIEAKVVADINMDDHRVILRAVNIVKIDEMSLTFKDDISESMVNLIVKHITNHFSHIVLSALEKQLVNISQRYLNKLLDKLPLSDEFIADNNISKTTLVNFPTGDLTYNAVQKYWPSLMKFHVHVCVKVPTI